MRSLHLSLFYLAWIIFSSGDIADSWLRFLHLWIFVIYLSALYITDNNYCTVCPLQLLFIRIRENTSMENWNWVGLEEWYSRELNFQTFIQYLTFPTLFQFPRLFLLPSMTINWKGEYGLMTIPQFVTQVERVTYILRYKK